MSENNISVERDFVGTLHIKVGDFDYVQIQYQHPLTDNASTRALADRIVAFLAQPAEAEGVKRWALDVDCLYPSEEGGWCEYGDHLAALSAERARADVAVADANDAERALVAVTAERDRLLSENARLIEDRARFPDRPDDIGHMIGSHIGNLKAGKVQAEKYARKWRDNLDSEIRAADQLRAEVDALRKDAERYRWLRGRLPGSAYRIAGVIYSEGGPGVDAAIDAAMAAKEA